jgi:hypothetical protein
LAADDSVAVRGTGLADAVKLSWRNKPAGKGKPLPGWLVLNVIPDPGVTVGTVPPAGGMPEPMITAAGSVVGTEVKDTAVLPLANPFSVFPSEKIDPGGGLHSPIAKVRYAELPTVAVTVSSPLAVAFVKSRNARLSSSTATVYELLALSVTVGATALSDVMRAARRLPAVTGCANAFESVSPADAPCWVLVAWTSSQT